jgi:hypothetical protein
LPTKVLTLEEIGLNADQDHALLSGLTKRKLIDLLIIHTRNIFRVDGLYFLGIEEKFGTRSAVQIDRQCWETMGAMEAHEIKKFMGKSRFPVADFMEALQFTSWSLDQRHKVVDISKEKGVFRVVQCRTQLTRLKKGWSEFPCKEVRYEYLKAFAKELNPQIEVACRMCPPDRRSEDSWCEWEFMLNRT